MDSRGRQVGLVNSNRHDDAAEPFAKKWRARLSRSYSSMPGEDFAEAVQAARS